MRYQYSDNTHRSALMKLEIQNIRVLPIETSRKNKRISALPSPNQPRRRYIIQVLCKLVLFPVSVLCPRHSLTMKNGCSYCRPPQTLKTVTNDQTVFGVSPPSLGQPLRPSISRHRLRNIRKRESVYVIHRVFVCISKRASRMESP